MAVSLNYVRGTIVSLLNTVDQEYFVGTKLAWVKCSMRFNFVELHAHEIILTRKF